MSDVKIRDAAFGKRLEQACDQNFHCPPQHHGRLRWISDELKRRFDEVVSQETVRRWLAGEVKPRKGKYEKLAEILGVDPTWLYLGVDPGMTSRERKMRNAEADGAVNMVAGFIRMDGGFPSFPDESDADANSKHIDMYAIIRGAHYAFHVTTGVKAADDTWQFSVPRSDSVIALGVTREGFNVRIAEITPEMIDTNGKSGGGAIIVSLTDEQIDASRVASFANRL